MSGIKVTDRGGGIYQAVIDFTYGECERLPFNILRRVGAALAILPHGGVLATADFNIRTPGGSAAFLEILDLFGEDGTFPHGSATDPEALRRETPPEGEEVTPNAFGDDDDELELDGSLHGS